MDVNELMPRYRSARPGKCPNDNEGTINSILSSNNTFKLARSSKALDGFEQSARAIGVH